MRYRAKALDQVLAAINSTGYGLTGEHSRVQATATRVVNTVNAGNIYINRNTIGAVVGVQPLVVTASPAPVPKRVVRLISTAWSGSRRRSSRQT